MNPGPPDAQPARDSSSQSSVAAAAAAAAADAEAADMAGEAAAAMAAAAVLDFDSVPEQQGPEEHDTPNGAGAVVVHGIEAQANKLVAEQAVTNNGAH
jgi:hypothetical protein